jgi:hypothetical protein
MMQEGTNEQSSSKKRKSPDTKGMSVERIQEKNS